MPKFTKRQLEIILVGLDMYKLKLKKIMSDSANLKVAEKEVKQVFLETEDLINTIFNSK